MTFYKTAARAQWIINFIWIKYQCDSRMHFDNSDKTLTFQCVAGRRTCEFNIDIFKYIYINKTSTKI